MSRHALRWASVLGLVVLVACGGVGESPDAGPDAGADAGALDAGARDAGPADAGARDAGPTDAGAGDGGSDDDDAGPTDAGSADGGADDACSGGGLAPGDHTLTLEHDGVPRSALVHVPPGLAPGVRAPVVLNFHGYLMTALDEAAYTRMREKADAAGFVAVHPAGLGRSWNAGRCCGSAQADDVDDVGFVRAILADLPRYVCFDPKRVYAAGLSNGGMLSHRLACEAADVIAAVGPVAGGLEVDACAPARPVPVLHFHGSADPLVPYAGNAVLGFPPIPEVMAGWAARDGCDAPPQVVLEVGDVVCEAWPRCAGGAEVVLCTVFGDGHVWPGSAGSSSDLDATEALWDFFARHALP